MMADPLELHQSADGGWESFYRRYSSAQSQQQINLADNAAALNTAFGALKVNAAAAAAANANDTFHTAPTVTGQSNEHSPLSLPYTTVHTDSALSHSLPVTPTVLASMTQQRRHAPDVDTDATDFDFDRDIDDFNFIQQSAASALADQRAYDELANDNSDAYYSPFHHPSALSLTNPSPPAAKIAHIHQSNRSGDAFMKNANFSAQNMDRADRYVDERSLRGIGGMMTPNQLAALAGIHGFTNDFSALQLMANDGSAITTSTRNLYVDQLPIPFSEHELRACFQPFGPIEKLRVATDPTTGEQMGYGFVMFANGEDAQRAILALHNRPIGHKTLHVSLAKQKAKRSHPSTPSSAAAVQSGTLPSNAVYSPSNSPFNPLALANHNVPPFLPNTNVYMAGIPHHYGKAELDDLMGNFGPIVESRVLIDKASGENRGIGFVRFESVEDAAAAIIGMNGQVAPGGSEVMTVKLAADKVTQLDRHRSQSNGGAVPAALMANVKRMGAGALGIHTDGFMANETSPRSSSQRPGSASGVYSAIPPGLMIPPPHQRSYSAIDQTTQHQLLSNGINSGPPTSTNINSNNMLNSINNINSNNIHTNNTTNNNTTASATTANKGVDLFVFHLPVSVTEEDLHQLFGLYGQVTSVAVMRDRRTGEHKGYGFVTMQNRADAENAVQYLTGFALGSKYLKVSFKTQKSQLLY